MPSSISTGDDEHRAIGILPPSKHALDIARPPQGQASGLSTPLRSVGGHLLCPHKRSHKNKKNRALNSTSNDDSNVDAPQNDVPHLHGGPIDGHPSWRPGRQVLRPSCSSLLEDHLPEPILKPSAAGAQQCLQERLLQTSPYSSRALRLLLRGGVASQLRRHPRFQNLVRFVGPDPTSSGASALTPTCRMWRCGAP